jgi:copper chaperone CopZ
MEETRYTVPGVSCSHCERAIAAEVGVVPGVVGVVVDLAAKIVSVRGEGVDDGAVRAAIADAGYAVA